MHKLAGSPASVALALLLGACSSSPLPKVAVAKTRLAADKDATLREEALSKALMDAQAASARLDSSQGIYNKAVESFVMELQRRVSPHDWTRPVRVEGRTGSWEVTFHQGPLAGQGRPEFSPAFFDSITPSHEFKTDHYLQRVTEDGVGLAAVLSLEDTGFLRQKRSFRPNNGIYAAGTVVLDFGRSTAGRPVPVRLRIINSMDHRRMSVAGAERTLASDLTSHVEANLGNTYIVKNGLAGLLRPDRRLEDLGLFALNAYDPRKIPVVFVHGLNSSPRIWHNVVNEIYADPGLRSRYQPLLFIYPTGMSVPAAAARLRQSLMKYRATWDPEGDDADFGRMVIVGHSMGGLLTRLQLVDSGEELRKAFFTRPIAENPWLTSQEKRELQAALVFKPLPYVERAVFVAVPHRGSGIADMGIVQLAVRLIKLPVTASDLATRAMMGNTSFLNPALLHYHSLGLRSVDMLSPEHPYFKALDSRPITVPFHSIIGDRGKGTGPDSSDGVVPYWSSHLDKAQSEKIVPHGHSCTAKRETVGEILRILKLHAGR